MTDPLPALATDLEARVASVWCSVFGMERVDRHDDFFELGGDSLIMIRLAAGLRDITGRKVPVRVIQQYPTVAQLATFLASDT